jgi:hypothetical protein
MLKQSHPFARSVVNNVIEISNAIQDILVTKSWSNICCPSVCELYMTSGRIVYNVLFPTLKCVLPVHLLIHIKILERVVVPMRQGPP